MADRSVLVPVTLCDPDFKDTKLFEGEYLRDKGSIPLSLRRDVPFFRYSTSNMS